MKEVLVQARDVLETDDYVALPDSLRFMNIRRMEDSCLSRVVTLVNTCSRWLKEGAEGSAWHLRIGRREGLVPLRPSF